MIFLAKRIAEENYLLDLRWMDDDLYTLLFRMSVNLAVLLLLVRFLYYPITKRRDYLFTFFMVGMMAFFLCFSLKKLNIDTGMGLSLFAIFGIIRYRTDTVDIKEMTYLFITIGISVFNALASKQISVMEMLVINGVTVLLTLLFEKINFTRSESTKVVTYEKMEWIVPEKKAALHADLELRTGLKINRFEIGAVNFLQDTAQIKIFFYEEQLSDKELA